ncbi:uncharacterized protein LOC124126747 [Haliotis rufescens]|uniref:uncharacterized protein LOC124126747 n=1 Tax=Haliotis rufescens TaxID=6454 RepID=UPI00201F22AC|nr:uncharacterized protein LOC124126747 [Haliotis rufescens]
MAESSLSGSRTTDVVSHSSSFAIGVRGKNMAASEIDKPLPVVELKPFTPRVWRREKSLPEFYDKPPTAGGENNIERRIQFENGLGEELAKSENNAALVAKYLFGGERGYTSESRLSDLNIPRYKIKLHPTVDFSYNCRPPRMNALIPEFIPRVERTKTTLQDVTRDDNPNRQYSLAKQAVTDVTAARHQGMRIHGGRVQQTPGVHRTQLTYLNPIDEYSQTGQWKRGDKRLPEKYYRPPHTGKGSIVNGHDSRNSQSKSSVVSSDASSVSSTGSRVVARSPMKQVSHRFNQIFNTKQSVSVDIGGIKTKNALQILSENGPTTKLEKQLTFEMEVNMEMCRRHLDFISSDGSYFPQSSIPNMFHDLSRPITLTKGEAMLRKGRDLNKRKIQNRRQSRGRNVLPVDFDRNVRQVDAAQFDSGIQSPRTGVLETAFHNGLFDRVDDPSIKYMTYANSGFPFSRGSPLKAISSKGDTTPTTDATMPGNSIPRDLESDMRLEEVKDSLQTSPRNSSYTSGISPTFDTYITEPNPNVGSHVMSLDSRVLSNKSAQGAHFTKAHFKPCTNVKLKDGSRGSDIDTLRAVT